MIRVEFAAISGDSGISVECFDGFEDVARAVAVALCLFEDEEVEQVEVVMEGNGDKTLFICPCN